MSRNEPVKVKYGIDPTGADVHMGHVVPVMLLRQFEKAGHKVDLIIGDFTARIGDPSDRETARVPLSVEQIEKNMATYRDQMANFVDISRVKVHYNSAWLNEMTLTDVFDVFQGISMTEAMQREDFRARVRNSQAVSLAEVCYGVLMGMDSLALKSDIEVGGIDQLLNFQQCRKVMRQRGMAEEAVLMTPLIEGTAGDGRKMSKSFGNYIAVNATPEDKFGKIMSIPDRLIEQYCVSFGHVHERDLPGLRAFIAENPMEAKKQLGTLIVAIASKSLETGLVAREGFERKFSSRKVSEEDMKHIQGHRGETYFKVIYGSNDYPSKSDLRRLFMQSAVRKTAENDTSLLEEKILGVEDVVQDTCTVRVGKRIYYRLNVA